MAGGRELTEQDRRLRTREPLGLMMLNLTLAPGAVFRQPFKAFISSFR